jgi:carbamate kinase
VVASPEPRAIVELEPIRLLLAAGVIVICAGGGGVPVLRAPDGSLAGVEAVVDKDLTAASLSLPAGSMAPKAEAAARFVAATGAQAAIGRLEDASALLAGRAGTVIRWASHP